MSSKKIKFRVEAVKQQARISLPSMGNATSIVTVEELLLSASEVCRY